jgi:hypothetical protein
MEKQDMNIFKIPFIMDPRTSVISTSNLWFLGGRNEMEKETLEYISKNYDLTQCFLETNSKEKINHKDQKIFSQILLEFYENNRHLSTALISNKLSNAENEFKFYLTQANCQMVHCYPDKNILSNWRNSSDQYPILSNLVKDFFAIQATSASSESLFFSAGNFFDKKRGRTRTETLRLVTCLKNWGKKKET